MDRERLRATFTEDAELYDKARPTYPDALVDALPLRPGCRVLEIGCGTGQATRALAERGCSVTAVELGANLAAVTRRNLSAFPQVEVVNTTFEDWTLPAAPFDLVVAASSFHWLDPAVRARKAAEALRHDGGSLAIITTHHVEGGTSPFFAEVQECYERFDPATRPGLRLTAASDVPSTDYNLDTHFERLSIRRVTRDIAYTTSEYLDVLLTYSGHRALPPSARRGLLTCIERLIEDRHSGRVTKRYLFELQMAVRR
ncbi:class I SAM-dependent methyltransferase [Actinomadura harenae]|nr:class I SAM-dependent methyltransferase [Actinomadura harenae]